MSKEERGVLILVICLRANYSVGYLERLTDAELEGLYDRYV